MPTETKEKQYKKATGNLPPLALLEVGEHLSGEIVSVDTHTEEVSEKVKGKMVKREKVRIFYRIKLDEGCTVHAGSKKAKTYGPVTYGSGDIVSLPGAGALDSTLSRIANEMSGVPADAETDFKVLSGVSVIIKRLPDSIMKNGQFQGNPVRTFDVQYAV